MGHVIIRPGWQGREQDTTPQGAYIRRRDFIRTLGLGSIGAAVTPLTACSSPSNRTNGAGVAGDPDGPLDTIPENAPRDGLPAVRNANYTVPERPVTGRIAASSYNNYYEFINQGDLKNVWPLTEDYEPFPNTIRVHGLVEEEMTLDIGDLIRELDLEERIYRFRCVEAWSMTIPWTGFPLRKLVEKCKPLSSATHVMFRCLDRPKQMPGIPKSPWFPWPYYEGLRMDEAMNEMAFVATGMYGEPLPKQNGSPIRMVLPWKYGYKGPKSFIEMEFRDTRPGTFWNRLYPEEYGFLSNVNPNLPHPRWSQASERFISDVDTEEQIPTQLFNGYAEFVGDLYPDEPTTLTPGVVR